MRYAAYILGALLPANLLVEELRLAEARYQLEKRDELLKRVEEHNQRMIEQTLKKYNLAPDEDDWPDPTDDDG
jgi:hypothetical protein